MAVCPLADTVIFGSAKLDKLALLVYIVRLTLSANSIVYIVKGIHHQYHGIWESLGQLVQQPILGDMDLGNGALEGH